MACQKMRIIPGGLNWRSRGAAANFSGQTELAELYLLIIIPLLHGLFQRQSCRIEI